MKHRDYVCGGDGGDFDLRGAIAFTALINCGMREYHRVLDLGCGSLSTGKLLIPYLKEGHYYGIDPNEWLIDDGLTYEVRDDKNANFAFNDDFRCNQWDEKFDYILALSVLSHAGRDLFQKCLIEVKKGLSPNGQFVFTYARHYKSSVQTFTGWSYPRVVPYRQETVNSFLYEAGLNMYPLSMPIMWGVQHWAIARLQ